jgi:hypothetical protein
VKDVMLKHKKKFLIMSKTTPAKYAKSKGLKKLKSMLEVSGRNRVTVNRWYYDDRKLFDCILVAAIQFECEG